MRKKASLGEGKHQPRQGNEKKEAILREARGKTFPRKEKKLKTKKNGSGKLSISEGKTPLWKGEKVKGNGKVEKKKA